VHFLFPEHWPPPGGSGRTGPGTGPGTGRRYLNPAWHGALPRTTASRPRTASRLVLAGRGGLARRQKRWRAGGTHGILACVRYRPI
jgi:hypothetical protein